MLEKSPEVGRTSPHPSKSDSKDESLPESEEGVEQVARASVRALPRWILLSDLPLNTGGENVARASVKTLPKGTLLVVLLLIRGRISVETLAGSVVARRVVLRAT